MSLWCAALMAKILIADDEDLLVELLEFQLQQLGFEIVTATNGEEALSLTWKERPSLIILDCMMPVFNGFEVLRHLKSTPDLKHIPVIMLSARQTDYDIASGLDHGAADYVIKPFSPVELLARVKKALREAGVPLPAQPDE
jgi:DNA-binding response OmpR family regulator